MNAAATLPATRPHQTCELWAALGCLSGLGLSLYLATFVARWSTSPFAAAATLFLPCITGTLLGALFGELVALSTVIPLSGLPANGLPLIGRVVNPHFLLWKSVRQSDANDAVTWHRVIEDKRRRMIARGVSPSRIYWSELGSALWFLRRRISLQRVAAVASILAFALQVFQLLWSS